MYHQFTPLAIRAKKNASPKLLPSSRQALIFNGQGFAPWAFIAFRSAPIACSHENSGTYQRFRPLKGQFPEQGGQWIFFARWGRWTYQESPMLYFDCKKKRAIYCSVASYILHKPEADTVPWQMVAGRGVDKHTYCSSQSGTVPWLGVTFLWLDLLGCIPLNCYLWEPSRLKRRLRFWLGSRLIWFISSQSSCVDDVQCSTVDFGSTSIVASAQFNFIFQAGVVETPTSFHLLQTVSASTIGKGYACRSSTPIDRILIQLKLYGIQYHKGHVQIYAAWYKVVCGWRA